MEFSDMILINVMYIISISFHWLSHHMLSEGIKMYILNSSLHIVFVIFFMFLANLLLDQLKLAAVQFAIANDISEQFYSFAYIIFE